MSLNKFSLLNRGGAWLGAIRSWIQWNAANGHSVHWGSDDVVSTDKLKTVKQLEELAAEIAVATINEYSEKLIGVHDITFLNRLCEKEIMDYDDKLRIRIMCERLSKMLDTDNL